MASALAAATPRSTPGCSCSVATARPTPARWPGCARPGPAARLAIAWFDAHGDFNTPDTTPSGNVWGMPFAMLCGRGDPDLVAAVDGPTVMEQDAALFGGQVLDETESRMLAASRVAQFGAGMLGDGRPAGGASRAGRGPCGPRVDGIYIAFDMDCLDGAGGWAVTMPEPDGLALETAIAAVRILADGDAGRRLRADRGRRWRYGRRPSSPRLSERRSVDGR